MPGELHLQLDRAVEVEVPEEPVLVVADGGDGRHDQAPRPADLGPSGVQVEVLPEDAVVLLVEADGVRDGGGCPVLVGQDRVEVADLAEAVAAEGEGVRHSTQAPLADVEGALPAVARVGVAVGHDHLADGGAVQDRSGAVAVLVGDVVEDQPLERVQRHVQRPPLPADDVAVDREADPVGLGDVEAPEVVAQRLVVLGQVAAALLGQRHHAVVDDVEHLTRRHVHEGEQALDRSGVAVVRRLLAEVRDAPGHAPVVLQRVAQVAGRPRVDLDLAEVLDAPPRERRPEARVLPQGVDRPDALVDAERGAHAFPAVPADDLAAGQVDERLDDRGPGPVDDHQPYLSRRPVDPARWLVERDGGEPGTFGQPAAGAHRSDRVGDLLGGERVEPMEGAGR